MCNVGPEEAFIIWSGNHLRLKESKLNLKYVADNVAVPVVNNELTNTGFFRKYLVGIGYFPFLSTYLLPLALQYYIVKVAYSQKVQGSFFTSQNCHGNYSEKLPWTFPTTFLNLKLSMIKNLPLQI